MSLRRFAEADARYRPDPDFANRLRLAAGSLRPRLTSPGGRHRVENKPCGCSAFSDLVEIAVSVWRRLAESFNAITKTIRCDSEPDACRMRRIMRGPVAAATLHPY